MSLAVTVLSACVPIRGAAAGLPIPSDEPRATGLAARACCAPAAGQLAGNPRPSGFGAATPATGQVPMLLHRQAPSRTFGYVSDTSFRNNFGQPDSALVADRFQLAAGGEVCRVVAWAFFGGSYEPFDPPPPATETVRVRFYDESAGLPGAELLSQTFVDPPRAWTGAFVALGSV